MSDIEIEAGESAGTSDEIQSTEPLTDVYTAEVVIYGKTLEDAEDRPGLIVFHTVAVLQACADAAAEAGHSITGRYQLRLTAEMEIDKTKGT